MRFSGYCFHMKTSIYGDFQICISLPLIMANTLLRRTGKALSIFSFFSGLVRLWRLNKKVAWVNLD